MRPAVLSLLFIKGTFYPLELGYFKLEIKKGAFGALGF